MNFTCIPQNHPRLGLDGRTSVFLYSRSDKDSVGSVGAKIAEDLRRRCLVPSDRAWDFLSIALSVIAADRGESRRNSPDGWTRSFDVEVVVIDPEFWEGQVDLIQRMLSFLTTDIWRIRFLGSGMGPQRVDSICRPDCDSVVLLSGGLDSLIGAIDLVAQGKSPFAVSHTVRTDSQNQRRFAQEIGLAGNHLQLNHCAKLPSEESPHSDRARSIIFFAYGIVLGTCMASYADGAVVPLVAPENGLISLNPPLITARLGSLSTRTTHPHFLNLLQELLVNAGLNIDIQAPYRHTTKGEMLKQCQDQQLIQKLAAESTSCGRFAVAAYKRTHCGKCWPCLIRRSAFHEWRGQDSTRYVFDDLSGHSSEPGRYDDVRSAALAVLTIEDEGLDSWLGGALNAEHLDGIQPYRSVVERGMQELSKFLRHARVL